MTSDPLQKIAICGAGLAGLMCAAALSKILPEDIEITLIDINGASKTDMFYGTATTPASYKFLLDIGISEPDLLPQSNTSFSLGTRYIDWGSKKRSWTQSFHQALPVIDGVQFHHYLTRIGGRRPELAKLESYIMSVQAAKKSVFAHPPQDRKIPLSNVEYGYHFLPNAWRKLLAEIIAERRIKIIKADIGRVRRDNHHILGLDLTDQTTIKADLFIDCLQPSSILSSERQKNLTGRRQLVAASSFAPEQTVEGVCRELTGLDSGWAAKTPLQNGEHTLTICAPSSEDSAFRAHETAPTKIASARIGVCDKPWVNNHLAIGHSAAILEPLTPASILLLQRDIERLLELIPVSSDMTVESREYNRRFKEDYEHGTAFQRGLFESSGTASSAYWKDAQSEPISTKLDSKITQFQSRGAVVQYDLEPFGKEDWVQLHIGMGRIPRRYDPLAEKMPEERLLQTLENIKTANESMASKLPSHHIYLTKLLQYFRKKHD